MDSLKIKYATYSKAVAPQQTRMKVPGWAGVADKMEDGSAGQPWHCMPFVEGATYGLELTYPFETECHIVNDNGLVRIEWDFAKEPGGDVTGAEFATFFPKEASRWYLFTTRIDVQAPPGYVIRTEPHPRYFTDDTWTVPNAVIGHLQTEWWPRKLFVVFKVPPPGHRHIFRKGEPYAQIIFVPKKTNYELVKLDAQEEAHRRKLDSEIEIARLQIADNIWQNSSGYQLSNHYKILASAFGHEGQAGVEQVIARGYEKHSATLPKDKSIGEYLQMGHEKLRQAKYEDARVIYLHVLGLDSNNAEATSHLGICMATKGLTMNGLKLMERAIALQPNNPVYHANLGELLRLMGRLDEAESSFRVCVQLAPGDPGYLSALGLVLAQQGKSSEGIEVCRSAAKAANTPGAYLRLSMVLAQQKQFAEARKALEQSLALDPNFAPAQAAMRQLPAQ